VEVISELNKPRIICLALIFRTPNSFSSRSSPEAFRILGQILNSVCKPIPNLVTLKWNSQLSLGTFLCRIETIHCNSQFKTVRLQSAEGLAPSSSWSLEYGMTFPIERPSTWSSINQEPSHVCSALSRSLRGNPREAKTESSIPRFQCILTSLDLSSYP